MMNDNASLEAFLGVVGAITQADIPFLRGQGRLREYAVIYRVHRSKLGGGFGDQDKHPYAWSVLAYVDEQLFRINSSRGCCREWTTLDRTAQWMSANGFNAWWTRNDLELPAAVGLTGAELL